MRPCSTRASCAMPWAKRASRRSIAINILQATFLAMRRALQAMAEQPDLVLIDGNQVPPELGCRAETIVGGDARSYSIAAASIIAKVTRDRYMRALAAAFPGYGWETNVGYGSPEHLAALNRLGATAHHRRSFAPVRMVLEPLLPLEEDTEVAGGKIISVALVKRRSSTLRPAY